MERDRDSRKTTLSAGGGLRRRLQRIAASRDSSEGELHEKARLRDRKKSEHKKDRDRLKLNEKYKANESTESTDEEYKEDGQDGRKQRGIRNLRSSPAVISAAADEVIGAVVPRRTRSNMVRRVDADSSSGLGEELRSSPAMASVSSVGGDFPASSKKKKMECSVEKMAHLSTSGSDWRVSSTTQEDIEMEVVEALFDLMQQSQLSKSGGEKSVAADSVERKRSGQARSEKDENNAFSLQQNPQSVKVSTERKVAGLREVKREEGMADGGSSDGCKLPSFFIAKARNNPEPTLTKREPVATAAQNEEKQLGKDFSPDDGGHIANPRADKHVGNVAPEVEVDNVATDPEFTLQNANKRSATIRRDASVAIQLQKEKGGAAGNNHLISNVMGQSRHDLSSSKSTQRQNLMEQMNHSLSSFLPLSSGIHGLSGVLPYTGYAPPPPRQQAVARSSTGIHEFRMELPPFKFSEPRNKRCATHQNIARNIRNHKQMVESTNHGPSDSGFVSAASLYGAQRLDGNHLSLNKPWFGTNQGGQFLPNFTSRSEKDKPAAAAAFTNSKSNHVLNPHKNPHEMQSDSFMRGPGFIFPFNGHQPTGVAPTSLSSSERNKTSATSLGFNSPTFASKDAPSSPYMAMLLQSSGSSTPIAANNMGMPPLRGGQRFPTAPAFGSSPFNFSPGHYQQSSQTAVTSSHKQPPQSSKATTTSKSRQASATATSQQPMQLSNSSAAGHQFAQLMNFASIPPPGMVMMMSDKIEFVSPEMLSSSSQSSSAAAAAFTTPTSIQWHQQQQLYHQMQAKQMARDIDLSSSNYVSNKGGQHPGNFPPSAAGVVTAQPQGKASQSGLASAFKETTEAAATAPSSSSSPLCRRDVASILGNAQHPEPKC